MCASWSRCGSRSVMPPASAIRLSHASVWRDPEQLRRHLDSELVRLELLRDYRPPKVAPARQLLRRTRVLRDRRDLAPREVAHLPLGPLGELVVPVDALQVAMRVETEVFGF